MECIVISKNAAVKYLIPQRIFLESEVVSYMENAKQTSANKRAVAGEIISKILITETTIETHWKF